MVRGKMLQCLQHPCKLSMAPQKDADGGGGGGHADGTLSPTLTLGATVKNNEGKWCSLCAGFLEIFDISLTKMTEEKKGEVLLILNHV